MSEGAAAIRTLLGVAAYDLPRCLPALLVPGRSYLRVRNRHERLERAPDGSGYRCDWQWTSNLHAPKVIPLLGRWLMARALVDHPIRLAQAPNHAGTGPAVSFLIGHRGNARVPLLLATLDSIAAQSDVAIEAVVVEQSARSELSGRLPEWVRYVHTPVADDAPYNRAWALNVAARHARGSVLVLHDNDLLVPADYARLVMRHVEQGREVINLKRFIFYLDLGASGRVIDERKLRPVQPEAIMQNAQGGGSLALRADTFARLGAMDEGFHGWGGEDNELWGRCRLARLWEFGYVSLVHLWHAAQPRKADAENPTLKRLQQLETEDPQRRVERLARQSWGDAAGPCHDAAPGARHEFSLNGSTSQ